MVYLWTLNGPHVDTKNPVTVPGWKALDLTEIMLISASLGWFDATDCQNQIDGIA
ncbi:hypothetical protein [Roseobacter sp.]|uniref:hypothetical protein n=1 Tax=Roseobacter sp. TaxID=1907202 RepID=UPI00385E9AF5